MSSTAAASLRQLVMFVVDKVVEEDHRMLLASELEYITLPDGTTRLLGPAVRDVFAIFEGLCLLGNGERPQFLQLEPSGASRRYNIILQNYNGCASLPPLSLFSSVADISHGEKAMFVHCDMQYPDPPRTDRDPFTRPQNGFIRLSRSTRWRAYPSYRARGAHVCSAIDHASNHQ